MLAPDTYLQNRYKIIRPLGQGGMGTVYEAIDVRLENTVALKESHFDDERLRKQFEREARLLARLRHPALTRVIDHFDEVDRQFLVMDFIPGEDLWEMARRRTTPFSQEEVTRWGDQLLDALDYLHTQEPPIIHRDIKPQNLKLMGRGQIILLDFGLAKGFTGLISRVTTSASIFGYTPNYAPLEQIQGTGTSPRSDLYSLAATLYHLLTRVPPPDALTRVTATVSEQPDPLRPANELNPSVAHALAEVLHRAMALNPGHRPATATEMREALRATSDNLIHKAPTEAETILISQPLIDSSTEQSEDQKKGDIPLPTVASSGMQSASAVPETVASPGTTETTKVRTTRDPEPIQPHFLFPGPPPPQLPSRSGQLPLILGSVVGLLVIGIVIFVLASRSSQSDPNKAATSGATTSDAGKPIRVGVLGDFTGPTSSFGFSMKNGVQMAANEINETGRLEGRKIELVIEDDMGDPAEAASKAEKLVSQDSVHAVIGEVASSLTLAAAPAAQRARIPLISPASMNPRVTQAGDYIFRVCIADPVQGAAMAKFASDYLQAKRAAVLMDFNSDYSRGLAQSFKQTFANLGGQIVAEQSYALSDSDFSAQLSSINASAPDVIYLPGYYSEVATIIKQARQQGIRIRFLGGDGWDSPEIWSLGGDALNGSYITHHFSEHLSHASERFVQDYKKRYGVKPDAIAALSYDAMNLLADALDRATGNDGPSLREAIAATRNFKGVTGEISIDSARNAVKPVVILGLQDREYSYVYNALP